jgi:hypothetical protein
LGDEDVGMPPFGEVLGEDLAASAVGFVADEQAVVGKEGTEQRALASWCGAEVEGEGKPLSSSPRGGEGRIEAAEGVGEEHGAGFLDVVGTRVEKGVGRELRSLLQIEAFGTPGHTSIGTLGLCVQRQATGVDADTDRGLCLQSSDERFHIVLIPVAEEVVFEVFW